MRRERHDVGAVLHRVRVLTACDEARDVGGVEHEERADLVGDVPERARVDDAGVRGRSRDDDLRTFATGDIAHLVEVDALVGLGDAVGDEAIQLAAGQQMTGKTLRRLEQIVRLPRKHRRLLPIAEMRQLLAVRPQRQLRPAQQIDLIVHLKRSVA